MCGSWTTAMEIEAHNAYSVPLVSCTMSRCANCLSKSCDNILVINRTIAHFVTYFQVINRTIPHFCVSGESGRFQSDTMSVGPSENLPVAIAAVTSQLQQLQQSVQSLLLQLNSVAEAVQRVTQLTQQVRRGREQLHC